MRQIKTRAIVTRSIKWGDSSKIVSLFTRDLGRIDVIAKGARKKNNLYQGILETLNFIETIIYYSPKRSLQNIGTVTIEDNFIDIRKNIVKTGYAFSIIELLNIFFIDTESEPIFFDFVVYIIYYIQSDKKNEIAFWFFILKLTSFLGFKPEFDKCKYCGRSVKKNAKGFLNKEGSVICNSCAKNADAITIVSPEIINFLNELQNTHYKNISVNSFPAGKAEIITNFLLDFLRYHTEQKIILKSLSLTRLPA